MFKTMFVEDNSVFRESLRDSLRLRFRLIILLEILSSI